MGGGIDQSVSPGMGGFLAFFLLACALWLLMRNMLKHMRNLNYREELEEKQARLARGEGDPAPGGTGEGADPAGAAGDSGAAGDAVAAPEGDEPGTARGADDGDDVQTRPSSLSAGYPREPRV